MDRSEIIRQYFPDFIRENKEFRVLIDSVAKEMGMVGDYTQLFSDLSKLDKMPKRFLENFADQVGYTYTEGEDPEVQREIFKRIFSYWRERGIS